VSYTPKPGTGNLFKNDKKSKDIQPDYKGSICLPDGSTMQIAGWITKGPNGTYMALKLSPPLPPVGEPE
jgi:hypothetical protein